MQYIIWWIHSHRIISYNNRILLQFLNPCCTGSTSNRIQLFYKSRHLAWWSYNSCQLFSSKSHPLQCLCNSWHWWCTHLWSTFSSSFWEIPQPWLVSKDFLLWADCLANFSSGILELNHYIAHSLQTISKLFHWNSWCEQRYVIMWLISNYQWLLTCWVHI